MSKTTRDQRIEQQVVSKFRRLFPLASGGYASRRQVEGTLREIAQAAFREGEDYTKNSLMTVADIAEELECSEQQVLTLIRERNARGQSIGWRVPGTSTYLLDPEEVWKLQSLAGQPMRSDHGESTMRHHWIQVHINHGRLIADTSEQPDLYLIEVREWHSADGFTWERMPSSYAVYSGADGDLVGKHGGDRGPTTLDAVLRQYNYPGLSINPHTVPAIRTRRWSVDSRARRAFAAETEPADPEYLEYCSRPTAPQDLPPSEVTAAALSRSPAPSVLGFLDHEQ